jgi:hypothetical protein
MRSGPQGKAESGNTSSFSRLEMRGAKEIERLRAGRSKQELRRYQYTSAFITADS